MAAEHPPIDLPEIVTAVRQALPPRLPVWLVGGALRDILLRRPIYDLDFAVAGDALAAARSVARALDAAYFPLDAERGVGRVLAQYQDQRLTLDFARLRGPDLHADLTGRDFTANAMAVALDDPEVLIDPLGGMGDLRARVLRACTPTSFGDDPVRTIRAVRLSAQLNFRLEKATRAAVRAQAAALAAVSAERRRDEFIRCLAGPRPAASLRALDVLGLLVHLVPELAAHAGSTRGQAVWEHALATITHLRSVLAVLSEVYVEDAAADLTLGLISLRLGRYRQALAEHLDRPLGGDRPVRWLLMLAALLHDAGKLAAAPADGETEPARPNHAAVGAELAARRLTELRFSNDEVRRAQVIIANHAQPGQMAAYETLTGRATYRFFRDTGDAGVDVVLLALANDLAHYTAGPPPTDAWNRQLDVARHLLSGYFEQPEVCVDPPPLVNGGDLIAELGLSPGPQVGELLEAVREAQAAGEITDRAAALDFLRRRLAGR